MDLGAFAQIEDLEKLAEANGIYVPRLRGYRLMSCSEPYTEDEIQKIIKDVKDNERRHYASLSELHYITYKVRRQCETWNKYVGREDVLYIHSRMGGKSYSYDYDSETDTFRKRFVLSEQPWFLDHVRDAYDCTYCDIYAKITVFPDGE